MQQLLSQSKNIAGAQDRHTSLLRYLSLFTSNPAARLELPHKGQVCDLKLANAMHSWFNLPCCAHCIIFCSAQGPLELLKPGSVSGHSKQ